VMKFLHELYIMTSNVEKKFHHHTTLISKVISHVPILCPDDIKHFTLLSIVKQQNIPTKYFPILSGKTLLSQ
jgi:hypothetical protein